MLILFLTVLWAPFACSKNEAKDPSTSGEQAVGSPSGGDPNAWGKALSADAQRATDPAGDLSYATRLIGMAKPHVSQGDFAKLAQRLA